MNKETLEAALGAFEREREACEKVYHKWQLEAQRVRLAENNAWNDYKLLSFRIRECREALEDLDSVMDHDS